MEMHGGSVTFRLASSQSDKQGDRQTVSQSVGRSVGPWGCLAGELLVSLSLGQLQSVLLCATPEHEGQVLHVKCRDYVWPVHIQPVETKCRIFMQSSQCLVSSYCLRGDPGSKSIPLQVGGSLISLVIHCSADTVIDSLVVSHGRSRCQCRRDLGGFSFLINGITLRGNLYLKKKQQHFRVSFADLFKLNNSVYNARCRNIIGEETNYFKHF